MGGGGVGAIEVGHRVAFVRSGKIGRAAMDTGGIASRKERCAKRVKSGFSLVGREDAETEEEAMEGFPRGMYGGHRQNRLRARRVEVERREERQKVGVDARREPRACLGALPAYEPPLKVDGVTG